MAKPEDFPTGSRVRYAPFVGRSEEGTVSSLGRTFVHVRFDGDLMPKAVHPDDLTAVAVVSSPAPWADVATLDDLIARYRKRADEAAWPVSDTLREVADELEAIRDRAHGGRNVQA